MNANYEVVIVGAGSAGLAALREVRKRTQDFLLVNDGPWGTTCARVGCMPSKVLIEAANAYHRRHAFEEFGLRGADALSVDMPAVLRRVRRLRDGFVKGTLQATDNLGERAVGGRARLLGPGSLAVNGQEISARAIVLATGSSPVVPPAWQALGDKLFTTDTLFEREALPPRLAVIGLGAIGVEMAQALARLGIEVAAFEHAAASAASPTKKSVPPPRRCSAANSPCTSAPKRKWLPRTAPSACAPATPRRRWTPCSPRSAAGPTSPASAWKASASRWMRAACRPSTRTPCRSPACGCSSPATPTARGRCCTKPPTRATSPG
jgi:Pyruvate/2-oxoglutarate dehydrogenase complex, dihydrolipoamide dehydrogenase (E3) component, and related enzymes